MGGPRVRVAALLRWGDAVLLCEQHKVGRPPYWLLPGGGVEEGESLSRALARELVEECALTGVAVDGPIAIAESISPSGRRPRKHVLHLIFHGDLSGRNLEDVTSGDGAVRGHQLVQLRDIASIDIHPPIHRFLERWRPGDPFVHLGELWAR
jgi:ADP-ribose pyrophosphatase YjhB (NUDIX family)